MKLRYFHALGVCVMALFFLLLTSSTSNSEYREADPIVTKADIKRVTTIAPFPRGIDMIDGELYVLCRGRIRSAGGVAAEVDDQAGTIYRVDPNIFESINRNEPSEKIKNNGVVFALPTTPPFRLWDRNASPPQSDRITDRPYCTLRYHPASQNFFICAFSGVDKPKVPGNQSFSKNLTDAVLRYDRRTSKWYEVERHNIAAGGNYPHNDPMYSPPPHGWLNGPDNCITVGNQLYVASKENSLVVRYDLSEICKGPTNNYPKSEVVLTNQVILKKYGKTEMLGYSALAEHDGWMYISTRTNSMIIRVRLDSNGILRQPLQAELIAKFLPYNSKTGESANITDMAFDSKGYLYVISAEPSRIFRIKPQNSSIFDNSDNSKSAWVDLYLMVGNPNMKSENVFIDNSDRLFVTSGDGYSYQKGAWGTVYSIEIY